MGESPCLLGIVGTLSVRSRLSSRGRFGVSGGVYRCQVRLGISRFNLVIDSNGAATLSPFE